MLKNLGIQIAKHMHVQVLKSKKEKIGLFSINKQCTLLKLKVPLNMFLLVELFARFIFSLFFPPTLKEKMNVKTMAHRKT